MIYISPEIIEKHSMQKPAYARVYAILYDSIMRGDLAHDEKLTELEISAALNVSRTPVRQAITRLKSEGILQSASKRSVTPKTPDRRDILELLEASELLESRAAAMAAETATADDVAILREINASLALIHHHENDTLLAAARDTVFLFHMMVAKLSGNKYIYKAIADVRRRMRLINNKNVINVNDYPSLVVRENNQIIDAIEANDSITAELLTRVQLRRSFHSYLSGTVADEESE